MLRNTTSETNDTQTALVEAPWRALIDRERVPRAGLEMLGRARSRPYRTMREFAEQEIWLPARGPRTQNAPRRFSCEFQPYTGLWFDAIDSGRWRRVVLVAISQAGKTFCGSTIPIIYVTMELGQNVVYGIPDLSMARAKWLSDLLPVLSASRFAANVPERGPGSRGGAPNLMLFGNGASMMAMTGGARDKGRAGWTAFATVVTEADAFDRARDTSRETRPIDQLFARTRAFVGRRLGFAECTASVPDGFVWDARQEGTGTEIALPCPHCGDWVVPTGTEKDLTLVGGYEQAENVVQAARAARWTCWHCQAPWSETERYAANRRGVLVHRGQKVDRHGNVSGPVPETDTFSLRVTAWHNMFTDAGELGGELWRYDRLEDGPRKTELRREIRQFSWALPDIIETTTPVIEVETVLERVQELPRGVLPSAARCLNVFVDVHKRECFFVAMATVVDGSARTGYIVDYGSFPVRFDQIGAVGPAVYEALEGFAARLQSGYVTGKTGTARVPEQFWVDANWEASKEAVYQFARKHKGDVKLAGNAPWVRPAHGRMLARRYGARRYSRPNKPTGVNPNIGDNWHFRWLHTARNEPVFVVEVNADYWKSQAAERHARDMEVPGGIRLYAGTAEDHALWVRHMASEQPERKRGVTTSGIGYVDVWVTLSRENHLWDCLYNVCAMEDVCLAEQITLVTEAQRRRTVVSRQPPR